MSNEVNDGENGGCMASIGVLAVFAFIAFGIILVSGMIYLLATVVLLFRD